MRSLCFGVSKPMTVRRLWTSTSRPEVVFIFDGSDQQDLLEFLSRRQSDPRTRIVYCPQNLGVAGALNVGLQECRNDLVARFDADDIMMRGRLVAQYAMMNSDPQLDCLGTNVNFLVFEPDGFWRINPESTSLPEVVTREVAKSLLGFIHHPTVMYRKSSVLRAGGYDGSLKGLPEDYDLWIRMLLRDMRLRNLSKSYHLQRESPGSASNTFNADYLEFVRKAFARLHE